ncbi:MAG TPA: hypothetical protein VHW01_01555 [Polyangiaceae bacterium]|nr:hypothetical protein [Polyangiaceae bacterium]
MTHRRPTPEPRLALEPDEAERIRVDLIDYTAAACARAAGVPAPLLVRAAARLPLRRRDAERVRAALHTFTPRVSV